MSSRMNFSPNDLVSSMWRRNCLTVGSLKEKGEEQLSERYRGYLCASHEDTFFYTNRNISRGQKRLILSGPEEQNIKKQLPHRVINSQKKKSNVGKLLQKIGGNSPSQDRKILRKGAKNKGKFSNFGSDITVSSQTVNP